MKKRFYVFSMLAAGMLLAGCSDDLEGGQDGPNVVEGVTGYARLALNLPTEGATTRAANDNFHDGLLEEYTMNDGIIAFFTGSESETDEDATFVRAYSLNGLSNWTPVGSTTDQITTRKVVISEAPLPATGYQIYALVFLNPNGIVTSTNNGLSIGGTPLTASSSKLSDVRKFLTGQNVNAYTKKGDAASFFMSNAPLASTAAGESPAIKVQTLVPVHVYPTETEAEGNRPNEIYVERAVAKVTLSGFEYDDNGERAIFFARGVLETVKKLRWAPDIIHCQGWMCSVIPLYIKQAYQDEPAFANTKIVTSLFSEELHGSLGANFRPSIVFRDVKEEVLDKYGDDFGFTELEKLAIDYSDGIVNAGKTVNPELIKYAEEKGLPVISNPEDDAICQTYMDFYDKVLEGKSE